MESKSSVIAAHLAEDPLILSIDIGTSAVKILIFDALGRAVENKRYRREYSIQTSLEGAAEVAADELLNIVWQGIDAVLTGAGPLASKLAGVGVCTFVGNIMGIDQNGRPLTPVFTYADTRAEPEADRLRAEFDEVALHDRTGCHIHSSYLPARFRWLAKHRSDVFGRVHRWMSLSEYMELVLFGHAAVSYSVASWSGLLDRHQLVWDQELLERLPLDVDRLSSLVDINSPKQGMRREFATRWPALKNLPWMPAIGDGAAANIGSGCISPARIALTMGSTTAIRAVVGRRVSHVPDGLWCYRVDGHRSLPGGALSEGGSLFAWLKSILQVPEPAEFEAELKSSPADGHGLTVLPFLAGERSPGWQGHARATIHGISQATTPLEILQAGMEAVACRIALVFKKLASILPEIFQIVAGGGAIHNSPAWLQIITNMLGRATAVSGIREESSRGTALLALESLGLVNELEDIPFPIERTCYPVEERHAVYRHTIERQQRLYEKLIINDR